MVGLVFGCTTPGQTPASSSFRSNTASLISSTDTLVIKPTTRLASLLNQTDQRVVDGLVDGFGVSVVVLAHVTRVIDKLGLDGFINRIAWLAGRLGRLTRSVQNGRIQSYITAAVVGLLVVLWWIL